MSPNRFEVQSLGIGIAGLVDIDGQLRRASLVEFDGLDMGPTLETKLGVPVCIDNDVNCAALAELSDIVAASVKNSLLVTLGTGIRGALIVDGGIMGCLRNGRKEIAADQMLRLFMCLQQARLLGKLTHPQLASNLAIERAQHGQLQEINDKVQGDLNKISSKDITQAARRGDTQSLEVIDDFSYWIALDSQIVQRCSTPSSLLSRRTS